jgi:2-polyprenyl-3-methyl-5-hydroxy-6-metoxy-1,4-benzoquinol methylase
MPPETETYDPQEFWQERLSENFDLRGTGHPGLSAAYNERCYRLRRAVLDSVLVKHRVPVAGHRVLDAGSGSGFFVQHYLERGARVTGVDLTEVSVRELSKRFPEAQFERGDLSTWRAREPFDLVSCFDVLFHIVDEAAWDKALTNLADAVRPGGYFVFTEYFPRRRPRNQAAHNVGRDWETYRTALLARGLAILENRPTHHLMNSDLGVFRFLNRAPELLYRIDLALLTAGLLEDRGSNRIVLTRKADPGAPIPSR